MSSAPFSSLSRHCCFSSAKLAEKYLRRAKELISSGEREDVEASTIPLNCALELYPDWEKALELKARVLLYLKQFKEVIEMLHVFLPSNANAMSAEHAASPPQSPILIEESTKSLIVDEEQTRRDRLLAKLRHKFSFGLCKSGEVRLGWRYLILGQACCHLGMMDDAIILLQYGKKTVLAESRRHSNTMRDDKFCSESTHTTTYAGAETDLINHMIANIKLLLRRRAAAEAALEAGLYSESVRHFSKILENQKSTPPGFIADCYLHRAIAYQATGKVVDAIADCNRNLALNPRCTEALSVRASLHEMVKSFSECLLDLQQLKMIYEASLRYQALDSSAWMWNMIEHRNLSSINILGGLDYINSKIAATRRRLCSRTCSLAARTILDLPEDCSMEDVEKAYLLLSLKHSPDKAALFVEDCVQQDGRRDKEMVKEEAKASAFRLSQLIHKAYTKLLSVISEEEIEEQYELYSMSRSDFKRCRPGQYSSVAESGICAKVSKLQTENESQIRAKFIDEGVVKHPIETSVVEADNEDRIRDEDLERRSCSDRSNAGSSVASTASDEVEASKSDPDSESGSGNTELKHENSVVTEDKLLREGSLEAAMYGGGDKNRFLMEAVRGLVNADMESRADEKLRTVIAEPIHEELCHELMKLQGGSLSSDTLASAICQALSHENPNFLTHQHWLMNISDSWSFPLSQPLSVP